MKRAIVFPGQGSQTVGMGKELHDAFLEAREVFQEVDEVLKQKLSRIIFEGPIEDLTLTENTQPAIMAVSMAVVRVLEKQGNLQLANIGSYLAGHSLGEYSALAAGRALTLADTARLLKIRGQAMQEAVPLGQGSMGVLLGVEIETAHAIANEASEGEICQVANDNSPGQVVLSGASGAITRAAPIATKMGAKRLMPLNVSAPFHSELMAPAAKAMEKALEQTEVKTPLLPLIANVTAEEAVDIKKLLVQQVTGMVRWRETLLHLQTKYVTQTLELGPGKVLSGLTKRTVPEMEAIAVGTPQEIENFLKTL